MEAATGGAAAPSGARAERIALTVILEGGYQATVEVHSTDPILAALQEVLTDFEGKRQRRLFRLQVEGPRSLLCFPCHRLVGVHTEPLGARRRGGGPDHYSAARQQLQGAGIERSRVLVIDDFLPAEQRAGLLSYVLANQDRFVGTSTATGDASHRESAVLHEFPEYAQLMRDTIRRLLPQLEADLQCRPLSQVIEAQLTCHNDGNYYKMHNDNGSPEAAQRELTYVYYFHRHPKAFTGGELRMFDTRVENHQYVAAESSQVIEPADNRIVFFLSRYMHEVQPVRCPSRAFADSRFTINGWVHRR